MSKKLYSTQKWKRYMRARQLHELRRKRQRRRRGRPGLPLERLTAKQVKTITLEVPKHFSIVGNPIETVEFIQRFKFAARRHNLKLDMEAVNLITIDAITALLAEIIAIRTFRVVSGNDPSDSGCYSLLEQSGFYEHVHSYKPRSAPKKGRIAPRKSKLVEPVTAKELIQIGTAAAHGQSTRCRPAFSALIECMSNTHQHAAGQPQELGKETWYSTVYGDADRQRLCCTFLDTGVGIFKSVKYSLLRRAYRFFGGEDDREILKDILEGKVASRTGLPFRGKGLPSIYRSLRAGRIKTLVIVANDVYANVGMDDYKILKVQFPGTLLYWEA